MIGRRVVITGMGTVSPFGIGVNRFCDGLFTGKSGASCITSFDTSKLPTHFAAQVPDSNSELDSRIENQKCLKTMCRSAKFAMIAAKEAVTEARLGEQVIDPYRYGTSLGAGGLGYSDLEHTEQMTQIISDSLNSDSTIDYSRIFHNMLKQIHPLTPLKGLSNITTAHIAIAFNARGNCQTITTACTSSAQAIGEAYRQIKFGITDVMITGGSDSMINPLGLIAFSGLGVMTRNNEEYQTAARPFDRRRDGFMLGEGAAIFILEELEHCKQRGAIPLAELIGYASICDAFRLTDEPPEAWGIIEAMRSALVDACINPEEVDYINPHGTGTIMNDKTETFAIKSVFGNRSTSIPISSTKSMIGHLVSSAGAMELAACILAMTHQLIPPTINYQEADPECNLDYVPNQTREANLNVILSNSFGFGGQNACLIIRKFHH